MPRGEISGRQAFGDLTQLLKELRELRSKYNAALEREGSTGLLIRFEAFLKHLDSELTFLDEYYRIEQGK